MAPLENLTPSDLFCFILFFLAIGAIFKRVPHAAFGGATTDENTHPTSLVFPGIPP